MNPQEFRNEILRKMAQSGAPGKGVFELTCRCTLDCKMCYIHTKEMNCDTIAREKDGKWWISQIEKAYEAGMLFALLTGGECMLHPAFEEIYLHLFKRGIRTRINTNGTLLTEERVEFFKRYPPEEIQVTLYGSNDERYEAVTEHRVYHQVVSALERLNESGIPFLVSLTPCRQSIDDIPNMISFLKEKKYRYAVSAWLFEANSETGRSKKDYEATVAQQVECMRILRGTKYEGIPYNELPEPGGKATEKKYGMRCTAARSSFWLTWDGYIQPCSAQHNTKIICDDFHEAWEQLKSCSSAFERPIECEGCVYLRACPNCQVYRCQGAEKGHCNKQICEYTMRLISEGIIPFPKE